MAEVRAVGSSDHAAEVAARAFLDRGCTNLECKIAAHVASFGGVCWQTDRKLQEQLRRPDGNPYHRESIGRARRQLSRMGLLRSRRIYPGQKPDPKARFASAHGTTANAIAWREIGIRNPLTRGERRRARLRQETPPPRSVAPRYSSPPPTLTPAATLPPTDPLARQIAETERALSRHWTAPSSASALDAAPSSAPGTSATGPPE